MSFFLRLATPAPTITPTTIAATAGAPSAAAQRAGVASWMIALIAGIGGLIFLVLLCALIHCRVHNNRNAKKQGRIVEWFFQEQIVARFCAFVYGGAWLSYTVDKDKGRGQAFTFVTITN